MNITIKSILIQFVLLFSINYFWIEKDIVKALKLAIMIILVSNLLSIFNKKRVK